MARFAIGEGENMVMMLLGSLSRASTKLVLSFVLVIVIMVLSFAFAPGLIRGLQDWIENLNELLRTPPLLSDQGLILYRTLVNENTIFGILITLVARAIIEVCAFAFGQAFKSARAEKKGEAARAYYESRPETPAEAQPIEATPAEAPPLPDPEPAKNPTG